MKTRTKLLGLLAALSLLVGVWGPASAGNIAGTGKITCDGDGTLAFSGDVVSVSVSTAAGALVHNKPSSGKIILASGAKFTKYVSGDTTVYVGSGSGTAANVRGLKLVISGADAHLEATGAGKLAVRGVGSCVTASGKTYTWKSTDTSVEVSQ